MQGLEELIANLNKTTKTSADINMEGFVQLDKTVSSLGITMTTLVNLQRDILDVLKTQTNTIVEQREQAQDDRLRGEGPASPTSGSTPPVQKEDGKPGLGTGFALGAILKDVLGGMAGRMAGRAKTVAKGAGIAALAGIPAYAIGRGVFGRDPDSDFNPTQGYGFNPQLGYDPGRSGTYNGVMDPAKGFDRFAAGATGGAVIGAGLGSVVPGVGTALGGIVGGLVGGIGNYLLSPAVEKKLNEGLDKFIDSVEGFFKDGDMRLREEANELKNLELLNFELDGIKARTAEFDESGRIGEMGYLSSLKQRVKDAERKPQAEAAKAQTEETLGEIAIQQMDITYQAAREAETAKQRAARDAEMAKQRAARDAEISMQMENYDGFTDTNETPIRRSKPRSKPSFAEFRKQQGQPKGYDPVTGRPLSGGTGVVSKPKPLLDRVMSFFSNDDSNNEVQREERDRQQAKMDDKQERLTAVAREMGIKDTNTLTGTFKFGKVVEVNGIPVPQEISNKYPDPNVRIMTKEEAQRLEDRIFGIDGPSTPPPSPSPSQPVVPLTSPTSFQAPKQESMGGGNVIAPVNAPTNNSVTNNTITGKPRSYADSARGAAGNTADLYT